MRHLMFPPNLPILGYQRASGISVDPNNPGKTDLIAWWEMDEASGNALDSHTNNLTMSDQNSVGSSEGGRLFVSAQSEYFVRNHEALLNVGQHDMTFGCFVKPNTWALHKLFSKDNNTSGNRDMQLVTVPIASPNMIIRFLLNTSATGFMNVDSTANFTFGSWIFFCARYDWTNKIMYIQFNNNTPVTRLSSTKFSNGGTADFMIGRVLAGGNAGYSDMIMRRAFYYKRFLTNDQCTWMYNSGLTRAYSELA